MIWYGMIWYDISIVAINADSPIKLHGLYLRHLHFNTRVMVFVLLTSYNPEPPWTTPNRFKFSSFGGSTFSWKRSYSNGKWQTQPAPWSFPHQFYWPAKAKPRVRNDFCHGRCQQKRPLIQWYVCNHTWNRCFRKWAEDGGTKTLLIPYYWTYRFDLVARSRWLECCSELPFRFVGHWMLIVILRWVRIFSCSESGEDCCGTLPVVKM